MFRKSPPAWKMLLFLILASFTCMVIFVLSLDQLCYNNIRSRQPIYPDSTVISEEYNFIRPRAFGVTRITLSTSDEIDTVRQWIRQENLKLLEREQMRGLAVLGWQAAENTESEGSLLYLYSDCGGY